MVKTFLINLLKLVWIPTKKSITTTTFCGDLRVLYEYSECIVNLETLYQMIQYKIADASEGMLRLSKGMFDIAASVSKIKPISA